MNGLRCQAEVSHDRNFRIQDSFNSRKTFTPSLQFYRSSTALSYQAACIANTFFRRDMIAEPGHIGNDESAWAGACDGCGMVNHHIKGNGECVVKSEHSCRHRIAH